MMLPQACVTCMDAALHMETCGAPTCSLVQMARWGGTPVVASWTGVLQQQRHVSMQQQQPVDLQKRLCCNLASQHGVWHCYRAVDSLAQHPHLFWVLHAVVVMRAAGKDWRLWFCQVHPA
jgi:hypothetical protein